MQVQSDQRDTPRRRVLKAGHIVFNQGRSTIDCTVRDLSARGAKLQVNSVAGIPEFFDLVVPGNHKQPCRVMWRRFKELGVSFSVNAH